MTEKASKWVDVLSPRVTETLIYDKISHHVVFIFQTYFRLTTQLHLCWTGKSDSVPDRMGNSFAFWAPKSRHRWLKSNGHMINHWVIIQGCSLDSGLASSTFRCVILCGFGFLTLTENIRKFVPVERRQILIESNLGKSRHRECLLKSTQSTCSWISGHLAFEHILLAKIFCIRLMHIEEFRKLLDIAHSVIKLTVVLISGTNTH